jgi:adenine-specific DNA-methyltransferase
MVWILMLVRWILQRLRFWLSLVVDEGEPQPLPNLDFKIVCANTLIPLGKAK